MHKNHLKGWEPFNVRLQESHHLRGLGRSTLAAVKSLGHLFRRAFGIPRRADHRQLERQRRPPAGGEAHSECVVRVRLMRSTHSRKAVLSPSFSLRTPPAKLTRGLFIASTP
jgi:hypothetical protein